MTKVNVNKLKNAREISNKISNIEDKNFPEYDWDSENLCFKIQKNSESYQVQDYALQEQQWFENMQKPKWGNEKIWKHNIHD